MFEWLGHLNRMDDARVAKKRFESQKREGKWWASPDWLEDLENDSWRQKANKKELSSVVEVATLIHLSVLASRHRGMGTVIRNHGTQTFLLKHHTRSSSHWDTCTNDWGGGLRIC
jgi:hypothetical protein